jgi:predicted O-methyltransferase YrrM
MVQRLWSKFLQLCGRVSPNYRGVSFAPPGHFYSPLLDIASQQQLLDGEEDWLHVPLYEDEQRALYSELQGYITRGELPLPGVAGRRYQQPNDWFPLADAFLLSALLHRERPQRIVEIGSGYSSAVMLDTLEHLQRTPELTFIEPYPQRLHSLVQNAPSTRYTLHQQPVQQVDPAIFESLQAGDFLFIDSSHVAKIGSDVSYLFLRILPRLKPGVWVHVHDMFYPQSYPASWVEEGRAWNESLFIRALLVGNAGLRVRAFNCFARVRFPESDWVVPELASSTGSSLWMQTCAAAT